ncbi:uncharacterized protein [Porites lutea]|uniref:uncharacterized protein isoform X3 n=1 Tax=Porites lutea TaxID=51062 RepID=UPI003CC6A5D0
MDFKCFLFAAFFLVACVAFSSQDELTDVEAPAFQQAADNDVPSPELTDGEDVEDEEDTEIAEDDVGEDEDSDEMQEENDLEDPLWKGRRRRCRGLRKCFNIKSCRRRVCLCLRRRRRRTRPYYDETGSENEVNNAEDEVEEFEGTGKGRRRRPRRRCRKVVRKCFTRRLGLKRRRTCVRLCLRRCFYGDENANDN